MDQASSDSRRSPGDNEGSPPPDDLPACLSCRRRKSRCSRERPSCAQCTKIGAECQYVVKQKPGIKAGAVDSLGRRLEVLEQIMLDGSGNAKAQLVALLGDSNGHHAGNGPFPLSFAPSRQRQGSPTDNESLTAAARNGLADADADSGHPRKRQRIGQGEDQEDDDDEDEDDDEPWMPPLPSFPLLEAVVEAHFQTIHHWIPILHEMRFRARLKDPAQRKRLTVLLHALLSAAIKYVDPGPFGMTASDVTRQIRTSRRAVVTHAMESLSVENTQALVILAFDYIGSGLMTKAWPVIGSLTRIVDYLQLTTEACEDSSPEQPLLRPLAILERPRDWTEAEERRRLFWTVFLLDSWHTSLTSDDVRRRLPCGGGLWARSEPVSTPLFGIWDKAAARLGNSISTRPALYSSPQAGLHHAKADGQGDAEPDTSKLGAFAYCIEATENLSQVTSFFLRQGVDFSDRHEVKNWLTRFKELDLRLVHWKMFLPRQWQDSDVSRDSLTIKMDPNLTLAHISHNTCMILLHQHVAYPPARWRGVVKLPSACSAETCHLAAVETASIVGKYLRFMGGIVNGQFAFCAFVAARILLVHWRSSPSHALAPEFAGLVHSLEAMSAKFRGFHRLSPSSSSSSSSSSSTTTTATTTCHPGTARDLAGGYAARLRQWRSQCVNGTTLLGTAPAEILCDARHYILPSNGTDRGDQPSGFEAYRSAGVPSPAQGSDQHSGIFLSHPHRSPTHHARFLGTYDAHQMRSVPADGCDTSPRSQAGTIDQSPMGTAGHIRNAGIMAAGESVTTASCTLMDGMSTANGFAHGQPPMLEEDELTAMSHMLLGDQFLEMDRVITLQGTDFFSFEAGRPGLSR
ncbi:putative transcriptional regulatory protein [Escovopsis weberi]|uniref:Putative transcriptional regulatory protein n=1 Tax=Escovopsis weberi TaxID=150374 RepID=A0A0M8N2Q9_ESCWE|nr:putative transcriptional regulatory protein [Escovopsis weberi]